MLKFIPFIFCLFTTTVYSQTAIRKIVTVNEDCFDLVKGEYSKVNHEAERVSKQDMLGVNKEKSLMSLIKFRLLHDSTNLDITFLNINLVTNDILTAAVGSKILFSLADNSTVELSNKTDDPFIGESVEFTASEENKKILARLSSINVVKLSLWIKDVRTDFMIEEPTLTMANKIKNTFKCLSSLLKMKQ